MEINSNEQQLGFGLSIVNRYSRNRVLHAKDTLLGVLSSIKHMKISTTLTYRKNAHKVAEEAFKAGFRIFDTARIYGYSESELGKMSASHDREDLFICTKISDMDLTREGGAKTVRENLLNSLHDLKMNYVDLYLLHWPSGNWIDIYKQMDEVFKEGLSKHIGVCNFKVSDFEELSKVKGITMPEYCQIECHPFCMHSDVLQYCEEHGIIVLAHTPTGRMKKNVKDNEILNNIANHHNKSVTQVILKWHIQNHRIPITHTKNVKHINDNMNVFDFELSSDEISMIDSLNKEESLFHSVGIDNPNYKYNK